MARASFRNVANLHKYGKSLEIGDSPVDFDEQLNADAHRRELLVIELRLVKGVSVQAFEERHGSLDKETIFTLKRLEEEGFVERKEGRVCLSKRGILFYDTVASDLI